MDDTVLHIAARNNSLNECSCISQNGGIDRRLKGDLGYTPYIMHACLEI